MLAVAGVSLAFGSNHVLHDFSLTLNRGENIVVLGKSGAGKSVLIKCVIGLLRPDAGTITVLGQDVGTLDHAGLDRLRTRLGFLFQSNALYDSMTVRENLLFPLRRQWLTHTRPGNGAGAASPSRRGPGRHRRAAAGRLSGGMRKRIALARTLILRPDIILYDEPTTGLDPLRAAKSTTSSGPCKPSTIPRPHYFARPGLRAPHRRPRGPARRGPLLRRRHVCRSERECGPKVHDFFV
ncbi:ATP-binding cassette domain-containing protein [Hymenobacter sp. BRD128]|uniref:ABC transporter ATP-binding protein n=1 Tax=Hymenobacter sp. BRD128 TaxID=2675878 RepID=UPI001565E291|nr:ATP-binding cassette domain-containing protein [Hymenobacter sp. BRD128]QKG55174.1 ATP-binding cassette domain-containing protein [Hymenobacter sp. BRD128]